MKETEIKDLEKSYHHICTYSNTNRQSQILLQTFSNILTPVLPPILIPGIFDAFDENRDGRERVFSKMKNPIRKHVSFQDVSISKSSSVELVPLVVDLKWRDTNVEILFPFDEYICAFSSFSLE